MVRYLDGTYLVTDLTPNVLRAASLVPVVRPL